VQPVQAVAPNPAPVDWNAELQSVRETLNRGEFGRGDVLVRGLYERASAAGALAAAGLAALTVAKLKANMSDPAAAIDWARRAVDAGSATGDPSLQAVGWAVVASASAECDRPVAAIGAIGRAMALADEAMPVDARRTLFTGILITYRALGLWQQALPAARRAFEAEQRDAASPVSERARTRRNLLTACVKAYDQLALVDRAGAERVLQEMREHAGALLDEATQSGRPTMRAAACHTLGQCYTRDARWSEAVKLLAEAVDTPTEESAAELRERWVDLGIAQSRAGDAAAARKSAEQALVWHVQVEAPPTSQDLAVLVALEELLGRPERALALQRRLHAAATNNLLLLLDAQVAELATRLGEQAQRLDSVDQRQRAEGATHDAQPGGRQARTDALTGLPNRRAVEWAYAGLQARDVNFALLMLDIDHFKGVNERFGHVVGDATLKQVGALIAEALRSPDSVGRYGGEEFVVLLSDVDAAGGQRIAERLRKRIEAFDWNGVAPGLAVTISGGLVGVRPGEGLMQALSRADVLRFRAKNDGRNRIVAAPAAP
jgi:diguanylate cyclase (GGDEF)-like protein